MMQFDRQHNQIAAVILAAGASTRMGTPKQLLQWQGRSLLRSITETAIAADCNPIVVVLGAYSDKIQAEVIDLPVDVVNNPDWQMGMGSSIRVGIQSLLNRNTAIEAAILLLCDQPFVSVQIIQQLRSIYDSTHYPIVGSCYQDTIGVPALFHASLFSELLELDQWEGAKTVIQHHLNDVKVLDFGQGEIDVDTPDDYQWILSNFSIDSALSE